MRRQSGREDGPKLSFHLCSAMFRLEDCKTSFPQICWGTRLDFHVPDSSSVPIEWRAVDCAYARAILLLECVRPHSEIQFQRIGCKKHRLSGVVEGVRQSPGSRIDLE